ncbi:hypothetical protein BOTNAR_0130g00120 [Botryotinia narcissicola]|uniref:PRP38-assoc multi-domain protein n=1 Tax=Botryotinia narcissicola TaxID=278944 RepID=A0A4Z1II64_9HELO|nr:hypothetical protein BOTNAR_0130g00120 [Botryotinia narcissicola]
MAAREFYNPSSQAMPGPGILKPTAKYPTSAYHQQAQHDIVMNERSAYPTAAVYNPQSYSQQQPYYPPPPQAMDYNSTQPPVYGNQTPTQQVHQRDGRHQYQAVEPHSYRNLPPHLRPRRSISEPPDPHYLAQHIPGYHHCGRSTSSSYSSSPERSRSRSRNRAHSHSRARSTRSMSRSRHSNSHTHSRASKTRARNIHKDRNTFFGAFGGGLIGDLIMPGLGTLGGAILGGVGGRKASRSGRKNEKGEKPDRRRLFGGKTYEEEWREGRIARGEISG